MHAVRRSTTTSDAERPNDRVQNGWVEHELGKDWQEDERQHATDDEIEDDLRWGRKRGDEKQAFLPHRKGEVVGVVRAGHFGIVHFACPTLREWSERTF